MNGCQYMRPSFTLPASAHTSQEKWDLIFLSKEEFIAKYDMQPLMYDVLYRDVPVTFVE